MAPPGSFFWGVDESEDSSLLDPKAFQPITAADLLHAKGHVYPLLLVRLALTWVSAAHTSYRAAGLIFTTLKGLGIVVGPCAETIRLWLLRVGLFLLKRPVPAHPDWVYLVDLTIQLGQHKCLVILGLSLAQFRRHGCRIKHHDVSVLAVEILTHSSGVIIHKHLQETCTRTGTPHAIVSDHGGDVLAGIRLFLADFPQVIEIYDITHGLALLLKHELEPDARWDGFVKACQRTRLQVQQTAGSFLQPPAWRTKARYLNLEGQVKWANDMLELLATKAVPKVLTQLAAALGRGVADSRTFLEEKLGWLREYREEVRQWSYFQRVVKAAQEEIKHRGLRPSSWQRLRSALSHHQAGSPREANFHRQVLKLVKEEGAKVAPRECLVGSTDVLESLFGKYKDLAEHSPIREITANVLMIPLFVTTLTAGLLQTALESIHEQDVRDWLDLKLGPSPQTKKRLVLDASRAANQGPKPM